jgi:hypothetical protein
VVLRYRFGRVSKGSYNRFLAGAEVADPLTIS